MRTRHYTLAQVISHAVDVRMTDVHTAIPGRVLRYDATLQQADVQPLVKVVYENEGGEQVVESLPVVTNVPIMFPGAGTYRITFPVTAGPLGDTVLLVFSEASLDKWLALGGEVDPLDERRFHLSDAVALIGLRDFAHTLKSARADAMTMGKDDGPRIHIDGTKIKIGTDVTADLEPAGLGTAIETGFNNVLAWLAAHVHEVNPGLTTLPSTLPAPVVPPVKSTTVEVEK